MPPILAINPSPALPDWLVAALTLGGVLALIFGPTIVVGLLERRLVWPYTPLDAFAEAQVGPSSRIAPAPAPATGPTPAPASAELDARNPYRAPQAPSADASRPTPPSPLTADSARANTWFRQNGFAPLGAFGDGKGRVVRVRYDFWLSPDRLVLAIVGGGTVGVIPTQSTWLLSRLADGRCLETVNDQNGSHTDLGRLYRTELLPTPLLGSLMDHHRRRFAADEALPYATIRPLADHLHVRAAGVDELAARGRVRFLDPERTAWKYTPVGAIRHSFRAILGGMRRVLLPDRILARFGRRGRRDATR